LANQCGGWTINWQGSTGVPLTGTTILAAVRAAVGKGTEVTYARDGAGGAGAEGGGVVVGGTPYAEVKGDRAGLGLDQADRQAIANLKKAGLKVVVVVVSGRPLILGDALAQADAVVAAWLPGTEGQGVADVLFGDYRPTGKLSVSWPRAMEQIPLHPGEAAYD